MSRQVREIALVLLLIGGGVVTLFSSFVGRPEGGIVTRAVYAVTSPVQQAVRAVSSQAADIWNGYVDLIAVREENERLKLQLAELKRNRTALLIKEREHSRLMKLLDLRARYDFPSLGAQVIGEDAVGWYRTLLINRGSKDGVSVGMAVAVADGIVGKVTAVSPSVAKVMLITDPELSVDCRIARTRDRGVLTGYLEGGCILRYLRADSMVKEGDEIVTSGLDGSFPRGLTVGTVESVRRSAQGLFRECPVRPSANFSEVEEVLIITGNEGGFDLSAIDGESR